MRSVAPSVTLNDGVEIPQLGFGVLQIPAEETADTIARAFAAGYRHIDTAAAYGNEAGVGEALRNSDMARDEVFVTTKCPPGKLGHATAIAECKKSLRTLDLEYVDLYLIHWPVPSLDRYVDTWRGFVALREEGLARSIGVSNFQAEHLERIIDATSVVPSVNQIELHPHLQQVELRALHVDYGIVTEAWSPLGRGTVLGESLIAEIGRAHGKTPAQIVLAWHARLGNVICPKTANPSRIVENAGIFDVVLTDADMHALSKLETGVRVGPHPHTFGASWVSGGG